MRTINYITERCLACALAAGLFLAVWAQSLAPAGRTKLEVTPNPGNPPEASHVVFGSTNPLTQDNFLSAPLQVTLPPGVTNTVVTNLSMGSWYFVAAAQLGFQTSAITTNVVVTVLRSTTLRAVP